MLKCASRVATRALGMSRLMRAQFEFSHIKACLNHDDDPVTHFC